MNSSSKSNKAHKNAVPKKHSPRVIAQKKIVEQYDDDDDYVDNDVKTHLSWHAPGRPFRHRSKDYFINSLLIMVALEFILFILGWYLLMLVVVSLVFLAFALASVPPYLFYYKISSEGILVEDHFFIWDELYDFYFLKQENLDTLHVRTKVFIPGELIITLGEITVNQAKNALLPYLPFREYVKPTFIERAGNWLERNFPLEGNHA